MRRYYKLAIVLAGYAAALLIASAISYARTQIEIRLDPVQASGGMEAFGDLLFTIGLFGFLSLLPTALALYFLRPFKKFWTVFANVSMALAAYGVFAALLMGRTQKIPVLMFFVGFFGLMKMLGAPLFGLAFLICAAFAPIPRSRWLLLAAAGIEFAVGGYAYFCLWFLGHWA